MGYRTKPLCQRKQFMMLYVNGDSHTAAAEAVNPHAFAEDDPQLFYLGRAPHPENLAVSWGKLLSLALKSGFRCDAESGSSNDRIIRTTREWLSDAGADFPDQLIIIQWSTWEREEWPYGNKYLQVGASGTDHVPAEFINRYKEFVTNNDWQKKTQQAHKEIWQFHLELKKQNIKHIFFNGNNHFGSVVQRKNWGTSYIGPYDATMTYDAVIRAQGIDTVMPDSWHFGRDGHSAFNRFILNYIIQNKFV
jgi:hypothetical protein